VLVFDAGEEFCPQLLDCFWTVKGQALVHLAASEMAGGAARLKERSHLSVEIYSHRCGRVGVCVHWFARADTLYGLGRSVEPRNSHTG
jgi:hypothetical protein